MIVVKCIDKIRDNNNKITQYVLQDNTGAKVSLDPKIVKRDMISGQLVVVNLQITSDGRIIDKAKDSGLTPEEIEHKNRKSAHLLFTFLLGLQKKFNTDDDAMSIIKSNGREERIYLSNKTEEKLYMGIKEGSIVGARVSIFDYYEAVSNFGCNEDNDSYIEDDYDEDYVNNMYDNYEKYNDSYDERENQAEYEAKLRGSEYKDSLIKYVAYFESKTNTKVKYKLSNFKTDGELIISVLNIKDN